MMYNTAQSLYTSQITTINIDDESINKSKDMFKKYKNNNVIISNSYDDDVWECSDEYTHLHFDFRMDLYCYKKYYEIILGINSKTFIAYKKVFILFQMGKLQLQTLQNILRDIKHVTATDPNKLYALNDEVTLYYPYYIIEFFNSLPAPIDEEAFDSIAEALDALNDVIYKHNNPSGQRTLAAFDTYALFSDILKDYWNSDINEEERLFYYPLYLFWNITAVIPQRPREFLLMPRNCLKKKDDGYYLTLRRNKIKGSGKQKTYKINQDYATSEYKIPDTLATEILAYLDMTSDFPETELNTFFITKPHYKKWKICNKRSRYFTYNNMRTVLRYFYSEIILGKYGLQLQSDINVPYLKDGEIQMIHLGDTRHLSLINIIAEGGTPVIAMMLAGHDSVDMAAHYYSNITTFIECRTYRQYRKVLNGSVTYQISKKENLPPTARSYIILQDGSKCYSQNTINFDYTDCKKVIGDNGVIGYCPNCYWNRKESSESFFSDNSSYHRKIAEDCAYLSKVIHMERTLKGENEDIMQAMLRLKSSAYEYEKFLTQKSSDNADRKPEEEVSLWPDQ